MVVFPFLYKCPNVLYTVVFLTWLEQEKAQLVSESKHCAAKSQVSLLVAWIGGMRLAEN